VLAQVARLLPVNAAANPIQWRSIGNKLKGSAKELLYNAAAGLYKVNTTAAGA